jgi:hypothetical protein
MDGPLESRDEDEGAASLRGSPADRSARGGIRWFSRGRAFGACMWHVMDDGRVRTNGTAIPTCSVAPTHGNLSASNLPFNSADYMPHQDACVFHAGTLLYQTKLGRILGVLSASPTNPDHDGVSHARIASKQGRRRRTWARTNVDLAAGPLATGSQEPPGGASWAGRPPKAPAPLSWGRGVPGGMPRQPRGRQSRRGPAPHANAIIGRCAHACILPSRPTAACAAVETGSLLAAEDDRAAAVGGPWVPSGAPRSGARRKLGSVAISYVGLIAPIRYCSSFNWCHRDHGLLHLTTFG